MNETEKAARREELRLRLRDPSFQRVLGATGFSLVAWAIGCAFLAHPGEMLLAGFVLGVLLRPFLIAAMLAAWRTLPALRGALRRMAADPDERGYTSSGSEPGLGGTMLLTLFLLGPVLGLAAWSFYRQPYETVLVWTLLSVQGLLSRGMFLRFDEPLARNLAYNDLWIVGAVFLFLLSIAAIPVVLLVVALVPDAQHVDWWKDAFAVQYALALLLLAGAHFRDLLQRIARWKQR